jgi:hypothetical protein
MNDAHFMVKPDGHAMTSEFWLASTASEYTIKESPLAWQAAYGNLLDFTHEAVRRLRLDTVAEALARNRDLVDGFELDFNRFQVFFPAGKAAAGAPLLTELVRRVRATGSTELAREREAAAVPLCARAAVASRTARRRASTVETLDARAAWSIWFRRRRS